jgi:hypothetical protein
MVFRFHQKAKQVAGLPVFLFRHARAVPTHPAQGGMCLPYRDDRVKPGQRETVTKH